MAQSSVLCLELILYHRFSHCNKMLINIKKKKKKAVPSGHTHAFNITYQNMMDTVNIAATFWCSEDQTRCIALLKEHAHNKTCWNAIQVSN